MNRRQKMAEVVENQHTVAFNLYKNHHVILDSTMAEFCHHKKKIQSDSATLITVPVRLTAGVWHFYQCIAAWETISLNHLYVDVLECVFETTLASYSSLKEDECNKTTQYQLPFSCNTISTYASSTAPLFDKAIITTSLRMPRGLMSFYKKLASSRSTSFNSILLNTLSNVRTHMLLLVSGYTKCDQSLLTMKGGY